MTGYPILDKWILLNPLQHLEAKMSYEMIMRVFHFNCILSLTYYDYENYYHLSNFQSISRLKYTKHCGKHKKIL